MNRNKIVLLTVVVLLILLCGYIVYRYMNPNSVNIATSNSTENNTTLTPNLNLTTEIVGNKTFKVKLPINYSMKIFTDASGMKYKVDGVEYRGITGLSITNSVDKEIIKLQGVSGVGGNTNVSKCYNFPDMDNEFYDSLSNSQKMPNLSYKEFLFLNNNVRLTQDNNLSTYFEEFSSKGKVFCEPIFYSFPILGFTSDGGNTQENLYKLEIDSRESNENIYAILNSLSISYI